MQKYLATFFLSLFFLLTPYLASAANMSAAECSALTQGKGDCDLAGCWDGEQDFGGCGFASKCCAPIALFTEAVCEQAPPNGQGGTCKVSNINGGCENGTQQPVGMCSDTLVDNSCCVPLGSNGSLNPGMSEEDCTKAPSRGGPGGECVKESTCTSSGGQSAGSCTEAVFGADRVCCITDSSKAEAEANNGAAQVGQVNVGTKYTPLEKVPFINGDTFPAYVEGLYTLGLILVVISSLFMLVIGGFTYLTSAGNTHQISSAKHIITGALIGLVLALVSWLVLNTINPDLTSVGVSSFAPLAPGAGGGTTGGGAGGGVGGGGSAVSSLSAQDAAKKLLAHPNVTLGTSSGKNCPGGNASAKDNLEQVAAGRGMTRCPCGGGGNVAPSETLLNSLVDIANAGQKFTINFLAGACHSNGSNHYAGKAADIDRTPGSALDTYFSNNPKSTCMKGQAAYQVSGVKVCFEDASHYHVSLTGN